MPCKPCTDKMKEDKFIPTSKADIKYTEQSIEYRKNKGKTYFNLEIDKESDVDSIVEHFKKEGYRVKVGSFFIRIDW